MKGRAHVKKLMFLRACAIGAASVALLGAGTAAAAPDVVGMTYADAANEIDSSHSKAVVAARVGDKLEKDDCIVTNAWDAPFVRDDGGVATHASREVMLSLNCNGRYATATKPGASLLSPEGREAKAAAAEEQRLAEASTPGA
jgi:hypothetical protein